jgi:hypothetical protein
MLSFGRTNARGPRRRASRVSSGQELKASSARPWASASSSWVAASGSCQPSGTSVEESSAVIGAGAESSRRSSRLLAMTLLVSETGCLGVGHGGRNHAQTGPMGGPETRHESLSSNQVAERQESGWAPGPITGDPGHRPLWIDGGEVAAPPRIAAAPGPGRSRPRRPRRFGPLGHPGRGPGWAGGGLGLIGLLQPLGRDLLQASIDRR